MARIISFFLTFFIVIFLSSCVKEQFDNNKFVGSLNLTPGLASPIGYSHISIQKYLQDAAAKNELHIDPDGFLTLNYTANVFSIQMGDLISIPDNTFSQSLTNQTGVSIEFLNPGDQLTITDSLTLSLSLGTLSITIDSMSLKTGNLTLDLNTISGLFGTYTMVFPGIQKNGIPLKVTENDYTAGFSKDLSGYTLHPDSSQLLHCQLTMILEYPTERIDPGNLILDIHSQFTGIQFETLYGDFSGITFSLPDLQINPGIFSQFVEGHFEFANPSMKLLFSNSIGAPISINFPRFDATDRYGSTVTLAGSGVPDGSSPRRIAYPTLEEQGQTLKDSIILDKNNSNIIALLASNPNILDVNTNLSMEHPDVNTTSFIRSDSHFDLNANLEIPLWGKAQFLVLQDTLIFDYLSTTLPAPEELEKVIIHIDITNGFPVSVIPQVYLLDAKGMPLDSLFKGSEQLEGATDVNADGIADPHRQNPLNIELDSAQINNLKNTRYIIIKGKVETTNYLAENVKFFSSYFLDYNVGLIAQLKINTGL